MKLSSKVSKLILEHRHKKFLIENGSFGPSEETRANLLLWKLREEGLSDVEIIMRLLARLTVRKEGEG